MSFSYFTFLCLALVLGFCAEPSKCQCEPGYENVGSAGGKDINCQPVCSRCPENASCGDLEVCKCDPGYRTLCRKRCSKICPNGFCSTPEKCACNTGFLMSRNGTCEPQCKEGFRADDLNPANSACQPVCRTACLNGTCTAPDECSCLKGYTRSSATTCKPHCPGGCAFGDCVAPDECRCRPGFEKTDQGCQPEGTSTSTQQPTTKTPEAVDTTAARAQYPMTTAATNSDDLLPLHYSNCTGGCPCWIQFDDKGIPSTAKCAKECADHQDQACLNLANCRCDLPSGKMSCKDPTSEEMHYSCRVPQTEDSIWTPKWMVIMVSCAGIILGVAIVVGTTKYFTSRRNLETQGVNYNSSI